MKTALPAALVAAILLASTSAFAQAGQPFGSPNENNESTQPAQPETTEKVEDESYGPAFHAGDIDILLAGGLGGLAYPHIEPGIEIGIIPINDDFSISVGGGVDLGWCLLCAALDAVSDIEFSSSYIRPHGRVGLHFGTIGGLLDDVQSKDLTIDLYTGILGGPSFYNLTIADETGSEARVEETSTSVFLGPILGGRVGFSDNLFLIFLEYRFLLEVGLSDITYTDGSGNEIVFDQDEFSSDGSQVVLGIGLRI